MRKKVEDFNVGDVVCDMHYGLPEQYRPVLHHKVRILPEQADQYWAALKLMTGRRDLDNKYLYVLAPVGYTDQVTAVYIYDNRTFGTVVFEAAE